MATLSYKQWRENLAEYYCNHYGTGKKLGTDAILAVIDGNEETFKTLFGEAKEEARTARQAGETFDVYSKAAVRIDWSI